MKNKIPKEFLKKFPQLEQIYMAIDEFKLNGTPTTKCSYCFSVINVYVDNQKGILETNCKCGKSKYRLRWNPDLMLKH